MVGVGGIAGSRRVRSMRLANLGVTVRSRDDDSFREFVARREPALLRTAYLLTGDLGHAEDLVQTALLKTYRHWNRVSAVDEPLAYVRRVLVTTHTSWLRRLSSTELVLEDVPERLPPDAAVAEPEVELQAALRSLPSKMRAVLVLRYFDDLTEIQTAEILGCSASTVSTHAARGLARLRSALATHEHVPDEGGRR